MEQRTADGASQPLSVPIGDQNHGAQRTATVLRSSRNAPPWLRIVIIAVISLSVCSWILTSDGGNDYEIRLRQLDEVDSRGSAILFLHELALRKWHEILKLSSRDAAWDQWVGVRMWEPYEPIASCADETRVGRLGDGGKWICGLSRLGSPCVIYSLGSNGDPSFELAINEATGGLCEIHTFDPYEDYGKLWRDFPSNMIFHAYGVWDKNEEVILYQKSEQRNYTARLRTLQTLASMLNHTSVQILKADIDLSEWQVVPYLFERRSHLSIEQMLWEFHGWKARDMLPLFKYLYEHGYVMFHKEHNHLCAECCEFAWMRDTYVWQTIV